MLFQSLYTWIAARNSLPIFNFSEFLDFCLCYFTYEGFFLYTFCVLGLCLYVLLMKLA